MPPQRDQPDPVIEAYEQAADRSLMRENLQRSVEERFERLLALQRSADELRRAGCPAEGSCVSE